MNFLQCKSNFMTNILNSSIYIFISLRWSLLCTSFKMVIVLHFLAVVDGLVIRFDWDFSMSMWGITEIRDKCSLSSISSMFSREKLKLYATKIENQVINNISFMYLAVAKFLVIVFFQ